MKVEIHEISLEIEVPEITEISLDFETEIIEVPLDIEALIQ